MKNQKQSVTEYHLNVAGVAIQEASRSIGLALTNARSKPLEPVYQTPQWHHSILWAGFAFLIGMLIGAGLMAG